MRLKIIEQIKSINRKLISVGLSVNENFPKVDGSEIIWERYQNLSFTLKDSPYSEAYEAIRRAADYNICLVDGALIQLKYIVKKNKIFKHILLYYPNPSDEKYIDNPENFLEENYSNKLFTENTDKNFVAFPLRFDFDLEVFVEKDHPYSHATFGNYTSCRIPVSSPISPYKFINFILRSFYIEKYKEFELESAFICDVIFEETITHSEKELLHFNFNMVSKPIK